jgi:LCP family protein required for cell wall assembly
VRQHHGTRGERGHTRAPSADELGWDDSLYDGGRPPGPRSGRHDDLAGPDDADGPGGGERHSRRKKPKRRILRWVVLTLSLLVLATAGTGYLYLRHLNGNIESGTRNAGDSHVKKGAPNAEGQTPLNILLIGSDSRNSSENVALGGSRDKVGQKPLADVLILLHVSADRTNASMVSIPRDTRVDIPKCTDTKTGQAYQPVNTIINVSLTRGGPGCTLATVENLTGVYIDHWITIDFAGVVQMADAVGGVEVCLKQNVWDRPLPRVSGGSGLKLTAGKHKIKGKQALQWLRTRHAFYSDLGRAKAQHMYLSSMLRELKSQNVFTDTGRLMNLAEAATKALTVSEEIGSVRKLFDLGMQLKSVPTNRITTATLPVLEDPQNGNHLVPDQQDADKLWSMLREDVPLDANGKKGGKKPGDEPEKKPSGPDAEPAGSIAVTVVNGTGAEGQPAVNGRAGTVAGQLRTAGFAQASTDPAPHPLGTTTVFYPESSGDQGKANAVAVAEALHLPKQNVSKSSAYATIALVVGGDWRTGSVYTHEAPEAGAVPESAGAKNGAEEDCMDVYRPYRW